MPGPQRASVDARSYPSDIDARAPEGVLATIPMVFPRRVQPPHSAPKDNTREWSVPSALPKECGRNGIARRRSCAVGAETPPASASPEGGAKPQTGYPSIAVRRLRKPGYAPCDASAPVRPRTRRSPEGPRRDLRAISEWTRGRYHGIEPRAGGAPERARFPRPISGLRM